MSLSNPAVTFLEAGRPIDPRALAEVIAQHLSREDALFVVETAARYSERFSVLLAAHVGQEVSEEDFARLYLRICKRIADGSGAS